MKKTILFVGSLVATSLILSGCFKKLPTEEQKSKQPTGATSETANWQVYDNREYGFQIKYPSGWQFDIDRVEGPKMEEVIKLSASFSDGVHKVTSGMGDITALAGLQITKGTLEEYQEVHNSPVEGTVEETTISGYPATKEKRGFGDETAYMFEHPEGKYRVTLTDYTERFSDVLNDQERLEMREIIDKIFSTFDFVD